jgi:hypothetical protein
MRHDAADWRPGLRGQHYDNTFKSGLKRVCNESITGLKRIRYTLDALCLPALTAGSVPAIENARSGI